MRLIDPELQVRLDAGATHLCRCWLVRRRDGKALGFTDHDEDITFDGTIFRASSGLSASALQTGIGLSVDNGQAIGALSDAAVNEAEIRGGKFDKAEILHWLVDWHRPDLRVLIFRGHFGEIRRADNAFEVELRGLSEALNVPTGRSILKTCDRVLGDAKCCVDVSQAAYFRNTAARAGSSGTRIIVEAMHEFTDGWFAQGTIHWLDGLNLGEKASIKTDRASSGGGRELVLWQAPLRAIAPGDRFRIVAGCDKRVETCRGKFKNLLNFRGFPHVPGEDWVTAYPKGAAVHDGSSQQD